MTLQELISAGKYQVRSTPSLMTAYMQIFTSIFGRAPDCGPCTFETDWQRLLNSQSIKIQNLTKMSTKSFVLRDQHKIYTYVVENKKTKTRKPVRTFGNIMTEEFASNYLKIGSPEVLEARKAEFKVLPAKFRKDSGDEKGEGFSSLKVAELKSLAAEKGYPEEEYKSLKKDELVAYLEAKAIEDESGDPDDDNDGDGDDSGDGKGEGVE